MVILQQSLPGNSSMRQMHESNFASYGYYVFILGGHYRQL